MSFDVSRSGGDDTDVPKTDVVYSEEDGVVTVEFGSPGMIKQFTTASRVSGVLDLVRSRVAHLSIVPENIDSNTARRFNAAIAFLVMETAEGLNAGGIDEEIVRQKDIVSLRFDNGGAVWLNEFLVQKGILPKS